jgi:hypothetical protein
MSLARSPVDLLSFGPRAALGALLSLPDLTDRLCVFFLKKGEREKTHAALATSNLACHPSHRAHPPHISHPPRTSPSLTLHCSTMAVERATELLQDPRPPGDKAPDALGLVAGDLAALVRKGAAAEAGVVSSIASALPPDIRDALPPEFLSGGNARTDGRGGASSAAGGGGGEAPGGGASPPGAASSASDARASAEAAGLEIAARRVRDAASALVAAGAGAPGAALLRLNLAEARAGLAGALGALGPGADGLGEDAVGGVGALLDEVDAVGMRTGGVRKE